MQTSISRTFSSNKYGEKRARNYSDAINKRKLIRSNHLQYIRPRIKIIENVEITYRNVQEKVAANKILSLFGAIIILLGICFGAFTFYQNQQAIEVAEVQIATAEGLSGDDGDPDTAQPPVIIPSTDNKPSESEVMKHKAPANQPKRIEINRIGVFARVGSVGVNTKGEVGVPVDVYDASWFNQSSEVGKDPGTSVIVGHVGFRSIEGVFANIENLISGDEIKITMGDDRVFEYRVTKNETFKLDNFSMGKYLSYNDQTKPVLHLITCTGSIIRGSTTYDSRLVVSAELIN